MILQENYNEFIKNNGQISLWPAVNTTITQGPGYVKDPNVDFNYHGNEENEYAYSHQGYRAIDLHSSGAKLYAPFDCKCVFFEFKTSAHIAVFESTRPVICPDGYVGTVHFLLVHGGGTVLVEGDKYLSKGLSFSQGDLIYREGTEGGVPSHAHINVAKGAFSSFDSNVHLENQRGYAYNSQTGKVEWYDMNVYALNNDSLVEDIFYTMEGEQISFDSVAGPVWEEYITFTEYTGNVSTEKNGWYAEGSNWYFYKGDVKQKGWLEDPINSGKWYYLDPANDGAMVTGWFLIDSLWYYFNPKEGDEYHRPELAGGQMLRSTWIAHGTKWCYVRSGGAMIVDAQAKINGKWYKFDADGYCIEPDGSDTKYPNIPEVEA